MKNIALALAIVAGFASAAVATEAKEEATTEVVATEVAVEEQAPATDSKEATTEVASSEEGSEKKAN